MVKPRTLAPILALLCSLAATAQNYSVDDTITEYPNHGTFYHDKFEGRKTANGEIFDQNLFTAAHWKIKLGTFVMVTNRNSGLQVIVRVNDRCPKRGVFDMSHRAANSIGIRGCQPVTVRILPTTEHYIEQWEAQDARFDSVYSKLRPKPQNPSAPHSKTKSHKTNTKTKPLPPLPQTSPGNDTYNLMLKEPASHGEAFSHIGQLPNPYREKVLIDSSDDGHIRLILDVHLSKQKAQELNRALKHSFPDSKIIPAE